MSAEPTASTIPLPDGASAIDGSTVLHGTSQMGRIPEQVRASITGGICLAGAAYGAFWIVVMTGISLIFAVLGSLQRGIESHDIGGIIMIPVFLPFGAMVAGGAGALYAVAISLIILPLCFLFIWTLRLTIQFIWIGAFCGGAVGFAAMLPITIGVIREQEAWLVLLLGPALTTVFGQIGGAGGAVRGERKLAKFDHETEADGSTEGPVFQFQIRHLLWITVWLAALLTVIRLIGAPFELILPLLLGWLVFQAGTLYCGWWLYSRVRPWWRRWRANRST